MSWRQILFRVVACLLVAIALIWGGEVLDYLRFSQAVTAHSNQEEAAGGPWPQLHSACVSCHGEGGNPLNEYYPGLAGQPAPYLQKQLEDFASGARSNPAMSSLARHLSVTEIQTLAAYFAMQPVAPGVFDHPGKDVIHRGRELVEGRNCMSCHGAKLEGVALFPRLSNQSPIYLIDQLKAYRDGRRSDASGSMPAIAESLSDGDIETISYYLANYGDNRDEK